METLFRTRLAEWLRGDAALMALVNAVEEEGPLAASPPAIALVASAGTDWSHKGGAGREIRLALEIRDRGDDAASLAAIAAALERRIALLPSDLGECRVVVTRFVRSRAERRARSARAQLLEYSFLVLATPTE